MKKITKIISEILTGAAATATLIAGRAMATVNTTSLSGPSDGAELVRADYMPADLTIVVKNISNTALTIIIAVSVVMLLIGGFKYVVSGGDSKKVTDAKNTILYAIIGLVISFLAYAIVNFVVGTISGSAA